MNRNFFLKSPVFIIIVLSLAFAFPFPLLYASGISMYEQGDPAIGTAAVGQTVADDASAAYFNPAAMTALERSELLLGSQLLVMEAKFRTDPKIQNQFVGSDGGDAGMILPGGGLYYAQKFLKGRVAAGLAVNAPAGLGLSYENGWKGRYEVQKEMMLVANINPSIALKLTEWLHVGAGLSVYYAHLAQEMAIFNPPSVSLLPLQVTPNQDGKARLVMDDWTLGYNLGLMLMPRKGTKVGVSYRSQAKFKLHGHSDLNGLGEAYLSRGVTSEGKIESELILPRQLMVSTCQDINDRFAVLFDVGWQNWSAMKNSTISTSKTNVVINQDWHDTYRLGIGAHYRLLKRLKLKAGFSFDSDPSSLANRTPLIPAAKTWRWGSGLDYDINPDIVLSLNWEFIGMGKARIDKDIDPIVVDGPGGRVGPKEIFPGRQFSGDYNQYINLIGFSFRWKFGQGGEKSSKPIFGN